MRRIFTLRSPARVRFTDPVHAAIVTGFRSAGAPEELVLGSAAAAWTFATSGWSRPGGSSFIRSITISTADPRLAISLAKVDPSAMRHSSVNGDVVDLSGATSEVLPDVFAPGQDEIGVAFASPFLISQRGVAKKSYVRSLDGIDLSAAFSAGLSRRLGRPVRIEAIPDRLSVRTDGARPRLVRVRRAGTREIILPAHSVLMSLRGPTHDLHAAYYAGLGEKTRYGFGCPVALV